MFKDLINLFTKPQDQVKQSIDQTEVLALTAIFIRIAKLDGSFDINEREKIKELVKRRFEFNDEKTEDVLNMAARLEGQSNDNVQFINRYGVHCSANLSPLQINTVLTICIHCGMNCLSNKLPFALR